jgi:Fe-S cluster assembly protein SufD
VVYQNDILAEKSTFNIVGNEKASFLLLSDQARVSAIPKLSVYTSDIICSHGLAISNISKTSIEYLLSRGYTEEAARTEIIDNFFL